MEVIKKEEGKEDEKERRTGPTLNSCFLVFFVPLPPTRLPSRLSPVELGDIAASTCESQLRNTKKTRGREEKGSRVKKHDQETRNVIQKFETRSTTEKLENNRKERRENQLKTQLSKEEEERNLIKREEK